MQPASDQSRVARHEDEHLRRFVAARASGDAAAMRRWWDALVIDVFDRMDGLVAAAHRGRLDDEEHELAVAMSMVRFSGNLMTTFEGVAMGQLVNACKALAHGICIDVQRASMRRRAHEGPSLDAGSVLEDDAPAPAWDAAEAARRFEQDERDAEAREFLAWALPRIPSEDQRRVAEMTLDGRPVEEITAALGITTANAYQLRSRALRALRRLKQEFDA